MEVAYISNFLNHYQAAFANAMKRKGVTYWFLATEQVPKERLKLGFSDEFNDLSYVVNISDDPEKARDIVKRCDLLLTAYYANELSGMRVKAGGITFVVSERLFKPTSSKLVSCIKNAGRYIKYRYIHTKYGYRQACYFLLIGQYAADDYIKCGVPTDRILKFAYFPELSHFEERSYLPEEEVRFLWIGRLINWKHPDCAIRVVEKLSQEGYKVRLTMVGNGPMEDKLRAMARGYNIDLVGGVPFERVRDYLHDADIYLFTSDYGEGWGCVLNEAMSEGVAAVASIQAGATTFLTEHSVNGIVYDGSEDGLYRAALRYVQNPELIELMGRKGRDTMESTWNADVAVEHLLRQYERIKAGVAPEQLDGPCSLYTRQDR